MNVEVLLPDETVERIAQRAAELVLEQLGAPSTSGAMSEFVNVAEAAALLRAKPQRVYDLASAGVLSRTKDGSRLLIARAEILAYLAGEPTGRVAHRLPTLSQGRTGTEVAR